MKGLISVIIPIYNCEAYLDKCIQSIIDQTYSNLEILLIDDGSTDNSLKKCKDFSKKDPRIKVFHQENHGVSSARNKGINESTGEYISFIDSDDWIDKCFFEMLINGYKEKVDLSVVGVKVANNPDEIIEVNNKSNDYLVLDKEEGYKRIFSDKNFFGFPVNKLYKKNIIDKLGINPFDEKIFACEDTLFNAQYVSFCDRISYNESKLYYYYQRDDSATKKKIFSEKKLTVFDSLNKINDIYVQESQNNLEYLYEFYLYNYFLIQMLIFKTNSKCKLMRSESDNYFKYMMNSSKISFYKKLKIYIKYKYPKFFDIIRRVKRR